MKVTIFMKRNFFIIEQTTLEAKLILDKNPKITNKELTKLYKNIGEMELQTMDFQEVIGGFAENNQLFEYSPFMTQKLSDFDIIKNEKNEYYYIRPFTNILIPLEVEED